MQEIESNQANDQVAKFVSSEDFWVSM
jgi:hypothetical protein